MSQGVNKAILIGNLGADPEIIYTPQGRAVCKFRLATNEQWKDGDGAQKERTEWHRIVVWGKLAEVCGQYLKKGRSVYVEGRIQTRTYDKDGQTHYATEINAATVQFLGGRDGDEASDTGQSRQEEGAPRKDGTRGQHRNFKADDDSEIPF